MKKLNVTRKLMLMLVILGLTFTACTNNESVDTDLQELEDTSEIAKAAEIDDATDALDDVMIEVFEADEQGLDFSKSAISKSKNPPHSLPDCVTITVVLEQGYRQVTIDFGEDGCLVRGHLLKGKVIMSYERNQEAKQVLITYTKTVAKG